MTFKSLESKREYQKKWLAARRLAYFKDKLCLVCGTQDNLELDHIDPDTKTDHRIWSWAAERRNKELEKCQVLCQKHHLEKTIVYRIENRKHGRTMYSYGCRCKICFDAKSLDNSKRPRLNM